MSTSRIALQIVFTLPFAAFAQFAVADNGASPIRQANAATVKKAAFQPSPGMSGAAPGAAADEIVFSAPPREPLETGTEIYQPIADYLSKALGKKVVYKHPGTWGVYRTKMLDGGYDIIFDGPHFNSYRAEKLQHNMLVKLPGDFAFVTIVKQDNDKISNPKQLAGRTVCAHAPPNLGTLTLLNQFDNPARQPVILSTDGWKNIYDGVATGKCVGGVVPAGQLKKFDPAGATVKVIFKEKSMPNQTFSAGPRLSAAEQARIAAAMVAPEAAGPTEKLLKAHSVEKLVPANNQEYAGLAEFLKKEWGYY